MKKGRFIGKLMLVCLALAFSGCGYRTAQHASRMPQSVHVLAVPMFTNQTQTYRLEQILTRDVVREFIARTRYRVVNNTRDPADATLTGTILSAQSAPLTYDAQSGRISSAEVTVTMKVSMVDRSGRVLFDNPNYSFRQQYQVSREATSFFEEETPALLRMSRDFARTLVSDVLEGF